MLPITLDTQTQTDLFNDKENNSPNYELQVVNEGLFPEVRLYYLASKKTRKTKKQEKKNNSSGKRNYNSLPAEYSHVIKLAV
jgi:hypothetical protein